MRISVLVTSYGRRPYLERCIGSLLAQGRPPDEIVIVTRSGDADTEAWVGERAAAARGPVHVRHVRVDEPGVLAATRAGLRAVRGDVVAFIDDDAAARQGWLSRIEAWFAREPRLGALGGRDVIEGEPEERADQVGRITWYGRVIGNHEKAFSGSAKVEHLKGVNMSFRRDLLPEPDPHILGNAHHYEMDLCFAVRRLGYDVVYDGDLVVDHFHAAPRTLPAHRRGDPEREFFIHRNRVYVMAKHLGPARRALFLFYSAVFDTGPHWLEALRGSGEVSLPMVVAMYRGKLAGLRAYRRQRRQSSA